MAKVRLAEPFEDLFKPSRYKAYFGGRGSGKSHSFAQALVILGAARPMRILCCREIQRSIKDSVKRLIEDKIKASCLEDFYESTDTEIRGKNGTLFLFSGLRTNTDSIKSMEGLDVAWVEEANRVSQKSLDLLIPTVRKEGSELWFSWNPETELDPVDAMFRGEIPPPDSIIKRVNWDDNPWFPDVLKMEMEHDEKSNPRKHAHVWLGEYVFADEGAYYAEELAKLRAQNKITKVPHDPNAQVYTSWDIGVSDSTAIWFAQMIGKEIHLIEYLEDNGKPIHWYANELKLRPYNYAPLILPHDARARELGTGKSIEEILRALGFETTIAPRLSVHDGIEAVRGMLPKCWFDEKSCEEGIRALRAYRQNYDEVKRISRGPLHDWSSHGSDSLRYLAVGMKERTSDSVDWAKRYAEGLL